MNHETATTLAPAAARKLSNGKILALALLLCAIIAPFTGLYPVFLMKVLCVALFACAFNLLLGYLGLLSFGHAAYFGAAAYITGYAARDWGLPPELAILTGTAVAAVLGLVFGWLAIRRTGIYFAMITLAFAQVIYFIALQAPFTGGEDGLQQVPRGQLFGLFDLNNEVIRYFFILALFLIGFAMIYRTVHSPFGQALRAIRDNEMRAISLGYNVKRYKLIAFVISATLAGLAGAAQVLVFQVASLNDVNYATSGAVILMTLLGGMGTHLGPIAGAVIVVAMEYNLAQFGSWVTIIQGTVFVFCVLAFRRGVVGEINHWLAARKERR
jgi:branched-chain amino acid transport system permease protein